VNGANRVNGTTIKILLVGPRYSGKGQIGRAWGNTDADLPALQPVILYDRPVQHGDVDYRVVAWVLSFDPEFEDLRSCFYKDADGIIFTTSLAAEHAGSLEKIDGYIEELYPFMERLPPAVLVGVVLDESKPADDGIVDQAKVWAVEKGIPFFEAYFMDKNQFHDIVDEAFSTLLSNTLPFSSANE
jgi:hypothetical protein